MSEEPTHRSKRQKLDKNGRFAALERLKNLKGSKNKYEVNTVENVYDEVDEREYSKLVMARAQDDWIEDDGTGYIEDGREIFDDEEYSEEVNSNKNTNKKDAGGKRKRLRDITKSKSEQESESTGTPSIQNFFNKSNKNDGGGGGGGVATAGGSVRLDDDDVLADILGDISTPSVMTGETTTTGGGGGGRSSIMNTIGNEHSDVTINDGLRPKLIQRLNDKAATNEYLSTFQLNKKKSSQNKFPIGDEENKLVNKLLKEEKKRQNEMEIDQMMIDAELMVSKNLDDNAEIKSNESTEQSKNSTNDTIAKESTATVDETSKPSSPPPPIQNDDIDFSILNDDDNQFDCNVTDNQLDSSTKNQKQQSITTSDDPNCLKEPRIEKPLKSSIGGGGGGSSDEPALDNFEQLLTNWENICMNENDNIQENNNNNATNNSTVAADDELINDDIKHEMKIWFWDAYEENKSTTGELFLFGKYLPNTKSSNGNSKSPKEFQSICVKIENVDKCLYLLPRIYILDPITKEQTKQKVTLADVFNEFNATIAKKLNLTTFKSKRVVKNFAFKVANVNVPDSTEYLEIRYAGKYPSPDNSQKYNSIEFIFGTNTPSLETFLLERQIKGPCWLNIRNLYRSKTQFSWCKLDVACVNMNCIEIATERYNEPPPLVLMSIYCQTILNVQTLRNEVVMISCLINKKFAIDRSTTAAGGQQKTPTTAQLFQQHYCGFTRPIKQSWPIDLPTKLAQYKGTKTIKSDSERALLNWFMATVQTVDPDLIVTHDAFGCQLDVIVDRCYSLKLQMPSRVGRLKVANQLYAMKRLKNLCIGRMICDIKQSAEELNLKLRSYDLTSLCGHTLKMTDRDERIDITNEELACLYETGDGIIKLIVLTMHDCLYIMKIMCELNVLPLALQITTICGNLMRDTLQGGRSARNDFLLLHAFNEKNYIAPERLVYQYGGGGGGGGGNNNYNKTYLNDSEMVENQKRPPTTVANKKKAAYTGGLVLEPIIGFYDKFVLLMDFNSLYPSIIQEFNICFTTITAPNDPTAIPSVPSSSFEQGILPRQIRQLVDRRREVKKLMQQQDIDGEQKAQLNIRQMALKLTANSMYGCLGSTISRFYAQHLAALITHKGREILMNTKAMVEKQNFLVIYGDTDSIMINTNSTDYDQTIKVGVTIKQMVNKIYRNIELDIDGIFKSLLLLKKKKYAAVTIERITPQHPKNINASSATSATSSSQPEFRFKKEIKGLDIVRRDWSQIAVQAGNLVIDELFSDLPIDDRIDNIHSHLTQIHKNIMENTVPLALFTIVKQLTKPPNEYTNLSVLPHVSVAQRMNYTRNSRFKKGDMIGYIICNDGTDRAHMQRAYHIDELKQSLGNVTTATATEEPASNEKPATTTPTTTRLTIDTNYYLSHQIHPVVTRILDPISGTGATRVAECLGLDPKKFTSQEERSIKTYDNVQLTKSDLYEKCDRFSFKCIKCQTLNVLTAPFKRNQMELMPALQKCSNELCDLPPYQYIIKIKNDLKLQIRDCIKRYYANWLFCDDPMCGLTFRVQAAGFKNRSRCFICNAGALIRKYSETDLYDQLSYYQYIFDITNNEEKANGKLNPDIEFAYSSLSEVVDRCLSYSSYDTVCLGDLFANL